jgi:uncharacterized protein YjbI with pentapeptide repeats
MGLEPSELPTGQDVSSGRKLRGSKRARRLTRLWLNKPHRQGPADLSATVEKADDLDEIKKAVDDAATVGGGLWLSYLFVLFYLAVAAGAVTHEDLFFERSVRLPFLGVELPLLAFFFLAPILFLIVHAYTLVHLVLLTEKAKRFLQALHDPTRDINRPPASEAAARRETLQWQLPSNIFIQFLSGPSDLRESALGWLLRAIGWITLVIAPILLLLMMQIQFLPFHRSFITWTHRVALFVDLILVWWLWRRILSGRETSHPYRQPSRAWTTLGLALSAIAFFFSFATATFPGESQDNHWPDWRGFPTSDEAGDRTKVSLHNWLFQSPVNDASRRRWLPFSNTLVLSDLNVYEALNIDDPKRAEWRDFVFRARGRDLKGAIFDYAVLQKVDFDGAHLEGAHFFRSQLQGASLVGAQLQGANFFLAKLQGASLIGARLQGASFAGTQLQAAELANADLDGARLQGAELQGASLAGAQLRGASLEEAQLQGVSLETARLDAADVALAQLQGASFRFATLQATDLSYAFLWRSAGVPSQVASIRLSNGAATWGPIWWIRGKVQSWSGDAYQELLKTVQSVPAGDLARRGGRSRSPS